MSKNIPKPIVRIGHSTKMNGKLSFEIDGNKVHNMSVDQFTELITMLGKVRQKMVIIRDKNAIDNHLTERQYEEIETLIKEGKKLGAVKFYKELTDVGLYEAKKFVDTVADTI
jgi:ribosomal protein L7/L12